MILFRSDLYKLLPPNAHVVEVGVAEGYFSADMLRWGIEMLWMVDNWSHIPNVKGDGNSPQSWHIMNYEAAIRRTHRPEFGKTTINVVRGLSHEVSHVVPDNSLDLVYIDADHSYDGVMSDLKNWFPKLKVGGIVALHDYINPAYGVKRAVADFTHGKYTVHLLPELKDEDAGCYFIKT